VTDNGAVSVHQGVQLWRPLGAPWSLRGGVEVACGTGEAAGVSAGVACGVARVIRGGVPSSLRSGVELAYRTGVAAGVLAGVACGVAPIIWGGSSKSLWPVVDSGPPCVSSEASRSIFAAGPQASRVRLAVASALYSTTRRTTYAAHSFRTALGGCPLALILGQPAVGRARPRRSV
jgi:hypothetical protein